MGLIFDKDLVIEITTLAMQLAALPIALHGPGKIGFPII